MLDYIIFFRIMKTNVFSILLWRNWSSRLAVNQKVLGSSPSGRDQKEYQFYCF
jgi:hypothetical protein